MKTYFKIIALTLFCSNLFAQTLTPRFADKSRRILVPKYAQIFPEIHEGMIVVSEYPKLYYVSTTGEFPEYVFGSSFPFTRGNDWRSAYFSGGAMMGWRTKPGEFGASPFIVYPDGKYRDLPDDISNASSFVEGYALVHKGRSVIMGVRQVFIDKNGKEVFPALTSTQRGTMGDMNVYPVRENRRVFYNAELKKYGYADREGNIIIQPQFDKAENFNEGMAAVMIEENWVKSWGFIDMMGKMVIPPTYRLKPGRFLENVAAVRIGDSESDYEMAYIDRTGKIVYGPKPWNLNEFHSNYAWVGTGCEKLFVLNRNFVETVDLTEAFYYEGNGFGTCMFSMQFGHPHDRVWGIDFPSGRQMMNQGGHGAGEIFAPSGALLFTARDEKGYRIPLHGITEGGLMFTQVHFEDAPQIGKKDVLISAFINQYGEIVYFFEEAEEGFEGKTPVVVK